MSTLQSKVEDALFDPNPRQSEHRVKEIVAEALSTFDPSAKLTVTSYFNHTFVPDMVLSWGKINRPVFLRSTDNVPELGHDIDLLDELAPILFGLSTPPPELIAEYRLDERSQSADLFLTSPAAVEEFTFRSAPSTTDKIVRNSLARGGRGAIAGTDEASLLAATIEAGLGSASAGQTDGTRAALAAIEHYFVKEQASRLNRVVQAVWEGGGSPLDRYPGVTDLASDVEDLTLVYLIQCMDSADPVFWRGVGRGLSLSQLVEVARAHVTGSDNFQHLVSANLDVLHGRACMVRDMTTYDDPDSLRWGVDLPTSETMPALTLRGPAFHAFVTSSENELAPRLGRPGSGLPISDYTERTSTARMATVSVSVGGGLPDPSHVGKTTDSGSLPATTGALPPAQVDKVTVNTPSGRVTVDFPQLTGTGVSGTNNLVADLILATASLLVPLTHKQRGALARFLHVTGRSEVPADVDESIQPAGLLGAIKVGLATSKVVVGGVPVVPPGWIDRDEITVVDLAAADGGAAVVCTGGRGVGKSSVAAGYVRRVIKDPAGPRIAAWISGETVDAITAGMALLAARLGLADPDGDDAKSAAAARDYLTGLDEASVLVIDNAERPNHVRPWLPTGNCRVVLTSTDRGFTQLGREVFVDVYTPNQAVAYLQERTRLGDPDGAARVAEELGRLPLALAQATAVLTEHHLTYQEYLDRLQKSPAAVMLPATVDYPRSLAQTLQLSLDTGRVGATRVQPVVAVIALLDADGVTLDLLTSILDTLETPEGDGVDVNDAVAVLASASLVTWSAEGNRVAMHPLLSRIIRETRLAPWQATPGWPTTPQAIAVALAGFALAIHGYRLEPDLVADVVRHSRALLDHITTPEDTADETQLDVASTVDRIRYWLSGRGLPSAELALDEPIVIIRERILGPDHPHTLTSRNSLANDYRRLGRYREALDLDQDTLTRREQVLGPDHPDTLASRNNLANDYYLLGHHQEAFDLHQDTLTRREQVLGPDHPHTLQSRANLANTYRRLGRYQEALDLDQNALTTMEREMGPDHPDTLTGRNNLAIDYSALGRHQKALDLNLDTLTRRQRVLGPDHPDTLASSNNLALDYSALGRHQKALDLHQDTLTRRQRVLGPDHPDTLASRNNLASAYESAGDLPQAISLYERILTDIERVLGPDHPDTLTSRNNLASAYQSAGDPARAISLFL